MRVRQLDEDVLVGIWIQGVERDFRDSTSLYVSDRVISAYGPERLSFKEELLYIRTLFC